MNLVEDTQNRTATGQTNQTSKASRLAKSHQDYWKTKLRRRSYLDRSGERMVVPEWQVRMFHLGREAWFNLESANQAQAAIRARDIYLTLVAQGWDAALAKFKPGPQEKADICTVGEFLVAVAKSSHLRPRTLQVYTTKFRKLIADIAKVESGMKSKDKVAKHDYHHGGRIEWLSKVEGKRLSILTPEAITIWRNAYVTRATSDPIQRKSAERSAASILRSSRALFSPDILQTLRVKLPPNPFVGVKLRDPGPQRYHSEINPAWLLACAAKELREKAPQEYLALAICLWAGLRRKEADLLLWEQVDLEQGRLHVRRTRYFEPKTEESERMVDLAPEVVDILRSFKAGSTSDFVLHGSEPDTSATWPHYRCITMWRTLTAWLKQKGIRQRNAVHTLRKESGSLIASSHGIEAARQHLGHRDIRTTSQTYVDKKQRVQVNIPISPALQVI
jgi:integrase